MTLESLCVYIYVFDLKRQRQRGGRRNLQRQEQLGYGLFSVGLKDDDVLISDGRLEHMEVEGRPEVELARINGLTPVTLGLIVCRSRQLDTGMGGGFLPFDLLRGARYREGRDGLDGICQFSSPTTGAP